MKGVRLLPVVILVASAGCTPSKIEGPLSFQQDERNHLIGRARHAGVPPDFLDRVDPPLTPEELTLAQQQTDSCRSSYVWKKGLTYTGSLIVAGAAGLTIGGAYATGNTDTTKQIFGVTGGSMALLGTLLVAIGGMVQNHYSDIGCVTRLDVDKHE
jgi:hypothetical protein